MISYLLLLIALCSFLFYGVVGQDKTWLLAPVYLFSYTAIAFALLQRSFPLSANGRKLALSPQTANCQLPTASVLWLTFLLYGIAMIPQAVVPFEAKLVTLFVGAVIGAYLVWGGELTTFKDNRILLGALIFVVMLSALYGLIVHFKCPDRVLWAERYAVYEGRLMSTYICPNHFAHLMQMLMPFCVALLFIPQAGIYLKLLSAYSYLAFLPTLYLTESRAGWLGAITATGVVLCLMALRRSRKLFAFFVILVPLCSMLLLLGGWQYSETFQRRMKPVVEFLQQQNEEGVGSDAKDFRPQTWMDTIDMIKASPMIGFGPGNYRYTFPEYRNRFQGNRIVTGHPHNEYLELMADYGLVGFALFALAWCSGVLCILIASLKTKETRHAFIGFALIGAAAGTMVHSFFDFQMHVYPNALVFALLAALAWGPLAAQRAKGVRKKLLGTHEVNLVEYDSRETATQKGNAAGRVASGRRRTSELSAVGADLLAIADVSYRPENESADHERQQVESEGRDSLPMSDSLSSMWFKKSVIGLFAAGYLLGALLCLQIMGSSYLRALGDKRSAVSGARYSASGDKHSPAQMYSLAIRLDPQNWRAYKGMGNLLFEQRYYSLEMSEKVRLAEQERSWYEKAYRQNPKDPEACIAYGKVLIFLGKNQGTGNSALGTRIDGGTASVSSEVDSRRSALASGEVDDLINEHSTTINQLQARGLELLREACRYRPFNDFYWWALGVELRKAGRYEEALDAFHYSASIKGSPSTKMNIVWLNARLKALGEGHAEEEVALQAMNVNSRKAEDEDWMIPSPDKATANPELMDLLNKMGE